MVLSKQKFTNFRNKYIDVQDEDENENIILDENPFDLKFDDDSEFLEFEMWSFNEDKAIFNSKRIKKYINATIMKIVTASEPFSKIFP